MLGGRVKTLHPRVHAGILARRDEPDDVATLAEHGIEPFDLVCVNLYPFEEVAGRHGVTEAEAVEMIDIGGPSMLRGAAKNFAHVRAGLRARAVRTRCSRSCATTASSRSRRAGASRPRRSRTPPRTRPRSRRGSTRARSSPTRSSSRSRRRSTSPTARTRTSARAYYAERGARRHLLSRVEQLHGKELSFNNLNDLSGARSLAREFALPACVIVKHANPCGVARRRDARGGVRQGARLRPGRRRTAASSSSTARSRRRSGRSSRSSSSRCSSRPATPTTRSTALRRKKNTRILLDGERRVGRARRARATSACSAACSSRTATPRSRIATAGRSSPAR